VCVHLISLVHVFLRLFDLWGQGGIKGMKLRVGH